MPRYRVTWIHREIYWATVDANSPQEAIEKAKRGEYNDDADSDTGFDDPKSFKCDGKEINGHVTLNRR